MAQIMLIIGNGFDLDLGLKSSYLDFAAQQEWQDLIKCDRLSWYTGDEKEGSLFWQLKKNENENWFDIEEIIYMFVNNQQNSIEDDIRHNREDFNCLKKALKKYLTRISKGYNVNKSQLSYRILNVLSQNHNISRNVTTFNYTDAFELCGLQQYRQKLDFTQIHGSLSDDIVLGCEVYDQQGVNKKYSFLYKYNMLKKPNRIVSNMLEAKEVIFFGHSINEMDFCYFREYFKMVSTPEGQNRNLTIICKDKESEIAIKDNIRSRGIIVTDLYNNLHIFDFIHTDCVYNNGSESRLWENLLQRICATSSPRGITVKN